MAVRLQLQPLSQSPLHLGWSCKTHPFSTSTTLLRVSRSKNLTPCANPNRDAELASALASEVEKINTHLALRSAAMKKSREMLFRELCDHLSSTPEDVKQRWGKMVEDERWVLVKGFVSGWDPRFHPLSVKSVKELVDEHLVEDEPTSPKPSPPPPISSSTLFRGLKNIMGFTSNKGAD